MNITHAKSSNVSGLGLLRPLGQATFYASSPVDHCGPDASLAFAANVNADDANDILSTPPAN